jgi:hypothetical protein
MVELSVDHPQATLARLWQLVWGISRTEDPTADDALAIEQETIGSEG